MLTRGVVVGLFACSVLSSCVSDEPELARIANERVLRGRWVTLHTESTVDVCESSVAVADAFVERVSDYLGVPPAPIDYYLYGSTFYSCRSAANADPRIAARGGNCAFRSRRAVMASTFFNQHEVAHVIAQGWGGDAPALLEEGLATMIAGSIPTTGAIESRAARIEDNLDSYTFVAQPFDQYLQQYESMASFLRFVERRFGVAALRRWYSSVDNLTPARETREQFARATGVALDQVIADWRAQPNERTDASHLRLVECASASDVRALDRASFDGTFACRAYGYGASTGARSETVEVEQSGWYSLSIASDTTMTATVDDCAATGPLWTMDVSGGTAGNTSLVWLDRGRHLLEFTRLRTDSTLRWSVSSAAVSSARCVGAASVLHSAGSSRIVGAPDHWPTVDPGDPTQRSLLVRVGPDRTTAASRVVVRHVSAENELTLCVLACDSARQCVSGVRADWTLPLIADASGARWLELRARAGTGVIEIAIQ